MDRIQVRSLLNNNIYNSNRKYKVNDVVIHNSIVYQNVSGKQGEPGTNNDWIQIKINLDDVVTIYGTQDVPGLKVFSAKCEFENGLKLGTGGDSEIGYNEFGAFFIREVGQDRLIVGQNFVILGDYTNNKAVNLMFEDVTALRDVKFQNKNGTISYMGDTGWCDRTDTSTNQSLTASTDNLIQITSALESNGVNNLLDSNSKITPNKVGDLVTVDFAFNYITPSGSNNYLQVFLKVNGNIYRAYTQNMVKSTGVTDYVSVSFVLPVKSDFYTNGGLIYVNPSTAITISNRYIAVGKVHFGI